MAETAIPENLVRLHEGEEQLREKALSLVAEDDRLTLHLGVTEAVMDMLDVLRQFETEDEDLKAVKMLSLRLFNAFAASVKLALSGYSQNSALVMRDILETVFLIDLFRTDRATIKRWRFADTKASRQEFQPIEVRKALDARDGFSGQKRAAMYKLLSELAGHPNMKSVHMLRPKGMDARNGPFMEKPTLEAVLSEMGRLALQVGEVVAAFPPQDWTPGLSPAVAFARLKACWIDEFYPGQAKSS